MNAPDTFKLMQEISFLTLEEKLEILKESFHAEMDIRKEWVNFWNEE